MEKRNGIWKREIRFYCLTGKIQRERSRNEYDLIKRIFTLISKTLNLSVPKFSLLTGLDESYSSLLLNRLCVEYSEYFQEKQGIFSIKADMDEQLEIEIQNETIITNFSLALNPTILLDYYLPGDEVKVDDYIDFFPQLDSYLNSISEYLQDPKMKDKFQFPPRMKSINLNSGFSLNSTTKIDLIWDQKKLFIEIRPNKIVEINHNHPNYEEIVQEVQNLNSTQLTRVIQKYFEEKCTDCQPEVKISENLNECKIALDFQSDTPKYGLAYHYWTQYHNKIEEIPFNDNWKFTIKVHMQYHSSEIKNVIRSIVEIENDMKDHYFEKFSLKNSEFLRLICRYFAYWAKDRSNTVIYEKIRNVLNEIYSYDSIGWVHKIYSRLLEIEG